MSENTFHWLAIPNQYGYVGNKDLIDGPHDDVAGVERAAYLHKALFKHHANTEFVHVEIIQRPIVAKPHDTNQRALKDCQEMMAQA